MIHKRVRTSLLAVAAAACVVVPAEWNGTSFDGSPYLYHVHHEENGTVPQTLRWRYQDRQFAKEFVSLRSTVTDAAGNTQHQTIIRAYALG